MPDSSPRNDGSFRPQEHPRGFHVDSFLSAGSVEILLWVFLAAATLISPSEPVLPSSIVGISAVISASSFLWNGRSDSDRLLWRHNRSDSSSSPPPPSSSSKDGLTMGAVLVPLLMWRLADRTNTFRWFVGAAFGSILLLPWMTSFAVVGIAMLQWNGRVFDEEEYDWIVILWMVTFPWLVRCPIQSYPSMRGIWTEGEWAVVVLLFWNICNETLHGLLNGNVVAQVPLHNLVSLVGVMGTLMGCAAAAKMSPSLVLRAMLLVAAPALSVEACLLWYHHHHHDQSVTSNESTDQGHTILKILPRSIRWLLQFLSEPDTTPARTAFVTPVSAGLPRSCFLLYWAAILLMTALSMNYASPSTMDKTKQRSSSTTIARKFFHGVAILLFGPVTVFSPQLMSLGYAVALCALMVAECLRPLLPVATQEFYLRYLDPSKDLPTRVILSHMALIVGCALPLWIQETIDVAGGVESATPMSQRLLLSLWGAVILGVGDSMGAIIGTKYGKTKWGRGRSVEGSAAVFLSTALCCILLSRCNGNVNNDDAHQDWIPAVLFCTLLEAYTSQIDNLVLPLAGAVLLL